MLDAYKGQCLTAHSYDNEVLLKLESPRYQHVQGPDGLHLEDLWLKVKDQKESDQYEPERDNAYHLFTRRVNKTCTMTSVKTYKRQIVLLGISLYGVGAAVSGLTLFPRISSQTQAIQAFSRTPLPWKTQHTFLFIITSLKLLEPL